ncbi:tetratricopeptide repeat protein [Streptomyces sp. NPDC021224]|uniref:tetratricopeptide repeat protein n=1 Tax=unclassified Streptomyces TaxID=2593676 RepID=UPI00379E7FA5
MEDEGDGGVFGTPDAPDDDSTSGERVHALVAQGRFAEAHAVVGDAFVERNGSAGYLLRAWVLAQERRPAEAREAVDWALALAGPAEAADVFVLAGVVLLSLDEVHDALIVALRAGGADPDGWEPAVLLSDVYRRLGRVPDAVAAARRAVELAPREAEAQVALARSLSAGRGILGRIPRRLRAEHRAAVERSLLLGADPGQLQAPRAGILTGGVAVAVLWAIQLYRIETGDDWQFVAAGAVLLVTALLLVVLVRLHSRRTGTGAVARMRGIRATVRTELATDDRLRRLRAAHVGAVIPVAPLLTTGLVADRAWRRELWPLWAALPVTAAGAAGVVLALVGVHWWYGPDFTRRTFLFSWFGRLQIVMPAVLLGAGLAGALAASATRATWRDLALAHAGWLAATWAVAGTVTFHSRRSI